MKKKEEALGYALSFGGGVVQHAVTNVAAKKMKYKKKTIYCETWIHCVFISMFLKIEFQYGLTKMNK